MSKDELATAVLIGSFAAWGVLHVVVAWRLTLRRPWWRGAVALLVPPLAPYWAARSGDRWRATMWSVALATWGFARLLLAG
jgi:hypothetical protein